MGTAAEETERATELRPVPRWVAPTFVVLALLTLPWVVYLALTLPRHAVTAHYRAAWVGFDLGLAALLGLTGWHAYRGNRQVVLAATGTATLLVVDAWFDVTTTAAGPDLFMSVLLAVLIELPLAGVCLWIARHADRMVERRLRQLADRAEHAEFADQAETVGRTATGARRLTRARRRLARARGRLR
ncbi:hypothetical protein ABZ570_18005 [Micromonospora sp. NPDC007271]|uniref:hypothetical protein n=1 Tax=Micromonospora sp. NPDC007271 TaxID=3154587 RepID=UPI0033F96AD2